MRMAFAFLVMLGLSAAPAAAEDCKPLKLLNKIQMIADPKGGWNVPVVIDGKEKIMGLGLGSSSSFVTRDAITSLNLSTRKGNLIIRDLDGNVSDDVAKVHEFKFGYVQAVDHWFAVNPDPNAGRDGSVGTLARDMLFGYDVDIDFGTGVLSLFASDHCPDRVGYWTDPPPSTEITFKDAMVSFPVSIDGKEFTAILTLTDHSGMTQDVASHVFGLSPTTADLAPVPGSTSLPPMMGYYHVFRSVSFGGVTVRNLRVLIVEDELNKNNRGQSSGNRALSADAVLKLPHLIIGLNVLKYLHINIAPQKGKLFVSAASPATTK